MILILAQLKFVCSTSPIPKPFNFCSSVSAYKSTKGLFFADLLAVLNTLTVASKHLVFMLFNEILTCFLFNSDLIDAAFSYDSEFFFPKFT